jgi:hypothetical protein
MNILRRGPEMMTVIASLCAVGACAVPPPRGPTVMALPPQGKSLAVFQQEDARCRYYAAAAVGFVQPGQAGGQAAVGSAALGTALGAAAGAAIGAAAGNPGAGAAIGAATGLVGGTAVGANNAAAGEFDLQTRYNIVYTQCMYSFGNTVQSPPMAFASYPWYGYPWYGYPWYGYPWYWGGPGFVAGGAFVFGPHPRFHRPFHVGFHGGFHGGGGFHGK